MNTNNIITNAIEGMTTGVKLATNLIKPTYGGNGKNVIVESKIRPGHMIVNDAWSIVKAIHTKDHAQKIGLNFVKELCEKADKVSGDGRKTTLLILDKLLEEGYKYEGDKLQLKKDLDALIPIVESEIDKVTKPITVDEVESVATTASESEEIGKILQEIYQQIGPNGILNIEGSKTYETSYKMTNGVRFEMTGMLSPEFAHGDKLKAIYEKPLILVTKKKIANEDDINPLLSEMANSIEGYRDLIIFTNDMDSNVAAMLVGLHKSKGNESSMFGKALKYNICIIKAPTLWQNYVFEDFAKCVGATVIEDATGLTLKNMKMSHLGTCDRIEIDSEDTVITGIKDISEHCAMLAEKGDDDSKLRLSWLASKSAVLKLGANSETDLSYKLLKANDANRSTYLALHYGVVKGGGQCLKEIKTDNSILDKALEAPYNQNIANGCKEIPESIVDASMVIKRAVRNAVGIASTILTSDSIVYIPDLTPEEMAYNTAMKQSNPFNQ